jgi:hypothetical protein
MIDDLAYRLYGMSRMVLFGTLTGEGLNYIGESPAFTEGLNLRTGIDLALRVLPTAFFGALAYEGLKDAEDGTVHTLVDKLDKKL